MNTKDIKGVLESAKDGLDYALDTLSSETHPETRARIMLSMKRVDRALRNVSKKLEVEKKEKLSCKTNKSSKPSGIWHTRDELPEVRARTPDDTNAVLLARTRHDIEGEYVKYEIYDAGWLYYHIRIQANKDIVRWAYLSDIAKLT